MVFTAKIAGDNLIHAELKGMINMVIHHIQDHPDPAHPAEHAFFRGNNYNRYWVTDAVPAELIFTFHNDTQQVVNAIQIACETAAPSFAFDANAPKKKTDATVAAIPTADSAEIIFCIFLMLTKHKIDARSTMTANAAGAT